MNFRAAVIRFRRFASQPSVAPYFQTQNWRLASGLVLFAFVLTHFLNHALGVFGPDVMDAVQAWRRAVWRTTPGTILLYGAAAVHVAFAIIRVVGRATWRMPWTEALQIAFGFSLPFMLSGHIVATRGVASAHGLDDTYTHELRLLWPFYPFWQSALILLVWIHAMIGLAAVARTKTWYADWRDGLVAFALLVPTAALAGWIAAGREVARRQFEANPLTRAQFSFIKDWERYIDWRILAVLVGMALMIAGLAFIRYRGRRITVRYLNGRKVWTPPGPTLLEISRAEAVPHASVCGGRARCSTCRVRVIEGAEHLEPMQDRERAVLKRIGAPTGVRLACRIAPSRDLAVELLVKPEEATQSVASRTDQSRWGVERDITVLFGDLRGFTTLSEKYLAFDMVFLLNRYVALMTEAVERHGGKVDKFLGDGVLALFGVDGVRDQGSRAALGAAHDMFLGLATLNNEFSGLFAGSLRMGVGVHTGPVIIGRVAAAGSTTGVTALGDTVNAASRLQDATKSLGCSLAVSETTLKAAGVSLAEDRRQEITVRGRQEPLIVHALDGEKPVLTEARPKAAVALSGA